MTTIEWQKLYSKAEFKEIYDKIIENHMDEMATIARNTGVICGAIIKEMSTECDLSPAKKEQLKSDIYEAILVILGIVSQM